MLSSLGRNGFVESLQVTKHHRSTVLRSRRLCTANHGGLLKADVALWQKSGRVTIHPLASRLYTTPSPSETGKKDGAPQPIPQALRKPKVELRPGPVKAGKSTQAPTDATTAPKSAASHQASTSSASTSGVPEEGPIETTKHDLEDAAQHGILQPPPEGAGMIRRLLHQGKELFKFYWRGLKLIEANRRRAKALQERVKAGGPPLTRAELRFVRQNKEDLLKLIPFALIILIAEEVIPLVVLYAPFLLPSTCIMPSQKERIDTKRREKQKSYILEMRPMFELVHARLADPSVAPEAVLDSSSTVAFNGLLALSTRGPNVLRLNRLKRHLTAVAEDDEFLLREDLGKRLTGAELQDALDERGIITAGLPQDVWSSRLQWWLSQVDGSSVADPIRERMLLIARSATGK